MRHRYCQWGSWKASASGDRPVFGVVISQSSQIIRDGSKTRKEIGSVDWAVNKMFFGNGKVSMGCPCVHYTLFTIYKNRKGSVRANGA